jgi:hypothetical protein
MAPFLTQSWQLFCWLPTPNKGVCYLPSIA